MKSGFRLGGWSLEMVPPSGTFKGGVGVIEEIKNLQQQGFVWLGFELISIPLNTKKKEFLAKYAKKTATS